MARLVSIETFAVRLPRDSAATLGTAGSPTALSPSRFDYRWSATYPALYSIHFESALMKLTDEEGRVGWGEAQAPLAPEVACLIAERLLRPAVEGEEFDGSPERIAELWRRMYATMRVRGQTGGFMLDAIAGVDTALWDLAGKMAGRPTAELLGGRLPPSEIPAYWSGLNGASNPERLDRAREAWARGFRTFKLFYDRSEVELFDLIERLRAEWGAAIRIAVDALWRLDDSTAVAFGRRLDEFGALWLECPLPPESVEAHERLARGIATPLALGESYRAAREIVPFLDRRVVGWLQPDLGRCGLTVAMEWSRRAKAIDGPALVPHVSIAMGPQIAAALHFAAAAPNCPLAEYNPAVFSQANRFSEPALEFSGAAYRRPTGPGLGLAVLEEELRRVRG